MTTPSAAAWVSYQKASGPKIYELVFYGFLQKSIACMIGPSQSDDHVFGGIIDR